MPTRNPLHTGIQAVQEKVHRYKDEAKSFYFEVLLGDRLCPDCGAELFMTGPSECACRNGHTFDPTIEFQKSTCCGFKLRKHVMHYICSKCCNQAASRFLFDERLFDPEYFRERMREHRERSRKRREEIQRLLAGAKSGDWFTLEEMDIGGIPGLVDDLDNFIGGVDADISAFSWLEKESFDLDSCRTHISNCLGWSPVLFSDIPQLAENARRDKVWRFMTLLFMEQDREVILAQEGQDILVRRVWHEADA